MYNVYIPAWVSKISYGQLQHMYISDPTPKPLISTTFPMTYIYAVFKHAATIFEG